VIIGMRDGELSPAQSIRGCIARRSVCLPPPCGANLPVDYLLKFACADELLLIVSVQVLLVPVHATPAHERLAGGWCRQLSEKTHCHEALLGFNGLVQLRRPPSRRCRIRIRFMPVYPGAPGVNRRLIMLAADQRW
jgi:hypothetical protein